MRMSGWCTTVKLDPIPLPPTIDSGLLSPPPPPPPIRPPLCPISHGSILSLSLTPPNNRDPPALFTLAFSSLNENSRQKNSKTQDLRVDLELHTSSDDNTSLSSFKRFSRPFLAGFGLRASELLLHLPQGTCNDPATPKNLDPTPRSRASLARAVGRREQAAAAASEGAILSLPPIFPSSSSLIHTFILFSSPLTQLSFDNFCSYHPWALISHLSIHIFIRNLLLFLCARAHLGGV
jgi:hypothetical protein